MKAQWYVVYIRPNSEKRISEVLNRKKIENYFPVSKVVKNWGIDKKINDQPLFDFYTFVLASKKQILEVKKLSGVISLVYWLGEPVVMADSEINTIKRFLTDHVNVKVEKMLMGNDLSDKSKDLVVEEEGLLRKIVSKKIYIIIPSLGYKISAEDQTSNVRIISSDRLIQKPKSRSAKLFNPVNIFNNY